MTTQKETDLFHDFMFHGVHMLEPSNAHLEWLPSDSAHIKQQMAKN